MEKKVCGEPSQEYTGGRSGERFPLKLFGETWVGATLRNYFRSMNGGERNLESELLKNFINVLDEGCLH